jgi:hypothetical protein
VDYRQKINDVNFVLSGTDASARDYESVPAVKDLVITADTHVNGETACPHGCFLAAQLPMLAVLALVSLRRCTCLKSTLEALSFPGLKHIVMRPLYTC